MKKIHKIVCDSFFNQIVMLNYGIEKNRKLGNISGIASPIGFFGAMTWAIVKKKKLTQ